MVEKYRVEKFGLKYLGLKYPATFSKRWLCRGKQKCCVIVDVDIKIDYIFSYEERSKTFSLFADENIAATTQFYTVDEM